MKRLWDWLRRRRRQDSRMQQIAVTEDQEPAKVGENDDLPHSIIKTPLREEVKWLRWMMLAKVMRSEEAFRLAHPDYDETIRESGIADAVGRGGPANPADSFLTTYVYGSEDPAATAYALAKEFLAKCVECPVPLARFRLTDRRDPALRELLEDEALDGQLFDEQWTEVVMIAEEEGVPVAFLSAFITEDATGAQHLVIEHVGVRPGFRSHGRTHTLVESFLEEMQRRGIGKVIVAVNPVLPTAPSMRAVVKQFGGIFYSTEHGHEWYVKHLPVTTAKGD